MGATDEMLLQDDSYLSHTNLSLRFGAQNEVPAVRSQKSVEGKILVSEENLYAHQALKMNFEQMKLFDSTEFLMDGQELVDRVNFILSEAVLSDLSLVHEIDSEGRRGESRKLEPICALFLDFKMAQKNGLEAIHSLKSTYADVN